MLSNDGKSIFEHSIDRCDKKRVKNNNKMITVMLDRDGSKQVDENLSFLWLCSIPQGTSIIPPRQKAMTFNLMVPSFLSNAGTYRYGEIYKTQIQGKWVVFLTSNRTLSINKTN